MSKDIKHLTYEARRQIEVLLKSNILRKKIAADINISQSQLSREIKRNSNKNGTYSAKSAHNKSLKRKQISALNSKKLNNEVMKIIKKKLLERWSPQQISGRINKELNIKISVSGIYALIAKDRKQGGKLYTLLRRKGKKRRNYNPKKASKSLIPNRIDIDDRPKEVETKSKIGHWEGDTVVGKGRQSGLITLVERHSKIVIVVKIEDFKAANVASKISTELTKYSKKVSTITFDNGMEFAAHHKIKEALSNINIYFAHPYKSYQRGLNEHTNGLIREYFPKGTDFSNVSNLEVQIVQNKLNNRPRNVLNFKTPAEVFFRYFDYTV